MELSGKEGLYMILICKKIKEQHRYYLLIVFLIFSMIFNMAFLYLAGLRQNISIFGAIYEEMETEKGINLVNHVFNKLEDKNMYERGLTLLRQAGYENTYHVLFKYSFSSMGIVIISFLIMLVAICIFQNRQKKLSNKEIEKVLQWSNREDIKDIIKTRYVPESIIKCISDLKIRLKKQQQIHESDNEKIMQYMEDISHQLKTPLAIIRMICEKLEIKQPQNHLAMKKCLQQVDKMADMIKDLLMLGQFDCNKFAMHFVKTDIKMLIETVSNELSLMADQKDINIVVSGDGDTTWYCDEYWMKEIIGNILKNCIEHSDIGDITVSYSKNENMNQVIIKDCGTGFAKDEEITLFERYNLRERTDEKGTGLGLPIAQQAIKLHFGKIYAKNRETGGAEFRIVFPQLDEDSVYRI